MRETYRKHIRIGVQMALVSVIVPAILMGGCSTSTSPPLKAQTNAAEVVGILGEPKVALGNQTTIVELPITAISTYSATRASDPERVIIDLPKVDATQLAGRFPGASELVDEIRIQAQPDTTVPHASVEVYLRKPVDYQIEQDANTLRIAFRDTEEKKADLVVGVQAEDKAGNTMIQIAGNGKFLDYQVRKLANNRLEVDLLNIKSQAPQAAIPTASKWVKRLHMDGSKAGKVTLLVDFASPIATYSAENPGNTLLLSVNSVISAKNMEDPAVITSASAVPEDSVKSFSAPPTTLNTLTPVAYNSGPALPAPSRKPAGNSYTPFNKVYTGKPISLDLQEAEIKNVLRLLADVSGANIVIEPDVDGKVTLKVNRVPWDQVLDMILTMNNLGQEQSGGVVRVARLDKLKKELLEKESEIKTRQQVLETSKEIGEISTNYLQVNYAQATQIANKVEKMKSPKGKITVDERTNLILYSDYPAYIQNAKELLAKLDTPTPQVLIEARIVQLNANATRDLGIQWSFDFSHLNDNGAHTVSNNFLINHAVTATSAMGFGIGQIAGQTLWNIDMNLSALEQAGKGKIVSAPRVLTLDNIEATIIQGQQIPYRKQNEFGVVSTEFKDATLELRVIPHITPDQKVRLEIKAKKESANFSQVVGVDAAPAIDTRRIATELLVADGDTIVIGGVIEETETYAEDRTPGLSQLPVLGGLFKSERFAKTKNDLLIFISPRITGLSAPVRPKREAFSPPMGAYPPVQ